MLSCTKDTALPEPADVQTLPAVEPAAAAEDLDGRGLAALSAGRFWVLGLVLWAVLAVALNLSPAGRELNPYLSLTGLMVGFLVGLTGMGGGALLTPILILLFGFQPALAVGTDIAYASVTKVFGSWRHWRQGSVDKRLALWLALGSVPAGMFGATAVHFIRRHHGDTVDLVLYRSIGIALVLVGVLLVVRLLMKVDRDHPATDIRLSTLRKVATVAIGATMGFIVGITSVGSGTLLAFFLILFYPLAPRRIVGTDVFHATILLTCTGLVQLRFGNVDLWMVASLLLGSVPGVIMGSHLTTRTSARALRFALAVVLALSGLALLGKA